jgi:hypothetical protein
VIAEVARKYGLTISNIFHAGDGNMHPIILFDAPQAGRTGERRAAGEEILEHCIAWAGRSPASTASAWRRTNDGAPVQAGNAGDDGRVSSGSSIRRPAESGQDAAHRARLPGDPAAALAFLT